SASPGGEGRACPESCPRSAAAVLPPESASPSVSSPPSCDYSPRICPAVSSHSSSDVTPAKEPQEGIIDQPPDVFTTGTRDARQRPLIGIEVERIRHGAV